MGLKEMSNCAKGCIACGVCSAIVAAIMIPVGWLVIAPNMAQHALDNTVMNIPNSTVHALPDDLHKNHTAMIFNDVHLQQDTVPLYTKMQETKLVMNVPGFDAGWCAWPNTNLGFFTMPAQGIHHGETTFKFDKTLTVFEDTDNFVHWALMLTLGGFPDGTVVRIVGQPTLTAMGMINMDLHMGKSLNCTYLRPPDDVQAKLPKLPSLEEVESMDSITARRLSRGMGPVTLKCDYMFEMEEDEIDEVMANFTADMARLPYTTTTTTTTTAGPTTTTTAGPTTTAAPTTAAADTTTAAMV